MNNAGRIIQLLNPTTSQDAATKSYVDSSIPIGGIIMWSGAGVTLPSNWKLCDGTTYGSVVTPDLRSRFVKGASSLGVSRLENNSVGTGDIIKLGDDIVGEQQGLSIGRNVSISTDGTTVAVSGSGSTGVVLVYKYNETTRTWSKLGSTIRNDAATYFGGSISLSADGTIIAVGAYAAPNGTSQGQVLVYRYNAPSAQWSQLGNTIIGDGSQELFGTSVSITPNGETVAVGATAGNSYRGVTRVYRFNGFTWPQLGSNINGDGSQEHSGSSVSISGDGNIVAVGAKYNSGSRGVIRVYINNGGTWPQMGNSIFGEIDGDQFGHNVSLSFSGTTVAFGAYSREGGRGITRVYRNNGGTWSQLGLNIIGDSTVEYFGYSVSLSNDGMTVAVGAYQNRDYKGVARVYRYNATTSAWSQLGANILGNGTIESFGISVGISGDGKTVVVGGHNHISILGSNAGVARVYSLDTLLNPNVYGLAFIMRVS
jgi:hypothetical protein